MKTSPLLRSLVLSLTLLTSVPSFAAVKKEFHLRRLDALGNHQ